MPVKTRIAQICLVLAWNRAGCASAGRSDAGFTSAHYLAGKLRVSRLQWHFHRGRARPLQAAPTPRTFST